MLVVYKEYGLPSVLVHGDMWCNNVLLPRNADSVTFADGIAAVIDWQVVHAGSPVEDIARLMSSSVSSELRKNQCDELLHVYYDTLVENLGHAPFAFDQLKSAYEETFRYAVCFFLPLYPAFIQMIAAGVVNMGDGIDAKVLEQNMINDLKGLAEEAVFYDEKYGKSDSMH